jgi:phosphatidate cytidylyltransferase
LGNEKLESMIHPIYYYILVYLLLGAMGMALANRKANQAVRQQRWLKYCTYILIVGSILGGIFLEKFFLLTGIIAIMGFWEIIKAGSNFSQRFLAVSVIFIYALIALGLVFFSLQFNQKFLLFIYFQVFTFDGFSQIAGQLFGRHPLIPQISPSKTVEGLAGGIIFCLLSAILAKDWVGFSGQTALIWGLITSVLAFIGDTLASYVKRLCHIKDYSNLLPGHGGFLDRFDSLMMTGMGYVCLLYLQVL